MATECFIQFIWKYRLYSGNSQTTTCGEKLEILSPGEQNLHAGPDFFNARIRFKKMAWAGNVEVHRRSSDWYKHGHHINPAYNNVILHVVGDYDTDVSNSLGRRIQTMVPEYKESLFQRFDMLKRSESWLPCGDYIADLPVHKLKLWLGSLQAERAAQKELRIEQILYNSARDLDAALYMALAPGYGIPLNSLPFELLAKGVPYRQLMKYSDNLDDVEAILFGHSGLLLQARNLGPYPSALWNRYMELQDSLIEKALPWHLWKFLRLRPPSFPTLRISQFASLIHSRPPLAESILETTSLAEMEQILRSGASEYWTRHYLFGLSSPPLPKFPGKQFIATLIINVIIPFLTALENRGNYRRNRMQAAEILFQLTGESNQIIKNWIKFGIRANNAGESQALLQLFNVYCKNKRCLDCQIGKYILEASVYGKK